MSSLGPVMTFRDLGISNDVLVTLMPVYISEDSTTLKSLSQLMQELNDSLGCYAVISHAQ